jgi:transglutaminase-like putative cysteine protease
MRARLPLLLLGLFASAQTLAAASAVYFAQGRDSGLFDHYDVDGYSLEARPEKGGMRLTVRALPGPWPSRSAFPGARKRDADLPSAPDRDALVEGLTRGRRLESAAVQAILSWVSREIAYDSDRTLPQSPAAVFASRRAYCVGFSELAVDLLRRAGIEAATVQGVLVSSPSAPGYEAGLSGVYHRWIKIFFPDRGWRFADPLSPEGAIDARYVPFSRRAWTKPLDLRLNKMWEENP